MNENKIIAPRYFTNIFNLFIDMKINGSRNIECNDLPNILMLKWDDNEKDYLWAIRIVDIRKSLKEYPNIETSNIIRHHIMHYDEREKIIEFLDNLPNDIEKYNKLKAFW